MEYIKHDLEIFDYNKKYNVDSEHKWDFMEDSKKEKQYFENREKAGEPKINNTQSSPEKTGQIGTMIK